jgi:hypothetical protein
LVHAALSRGALTERLRVETVRLAGVRGTTETTGSGAIASGKTANGANGTNGIKSRTAGRRRTTQL